MLNSTCMIARIEERYSSISRDSQTLRNQHCENIGVAGEFDVIREVDSSCSLRSADRISDYIVMIAFDYCIHSF